MTFIRESRAVIMVIMGKAEMVTDWHGRTISSPGRAFSSPAVLRLPKYVHKVHGPPRFRRSVLYARDAWSCQYCGVRLNSGGLTIDHVVPKALGGKTTWHNCVTACKPCNRKKGCMLLGKTGMSLRRSPTPPSSHHFWDSKNKSIDDSWHPMWNDFLGGRDESS